MFESDMNTRRTHRLNELNFNPIASKGMYCVYIYTQTNKQTVIIYTTQYPHIRYRAYKTTIGFGVKNIKQPNCFQFLLPFAQ